MTEPSNLEEYNRRAKLNSRIEGYGPDVATVFPCPFCAAADWLTVKIIDFVRCDQGPAECQECHRSAMLLVTNEAEGVHCEFVQTAGADPPGWFAWPMRRVSA